MVANNESPFKDLVTRAIKAKSDTDKAMANMKFAARRESVGRAISNPSSVRGSDRPLTHSEYSSVAMFGW